MCIDCRRDVSAARVRARRFTFTLTYSAFMGTDRKEGSWTQAQAWYVEPLSARNAPYQKLHRSILQSASETKAVPTSPLRAFRPFKITCFRQDQREEARVIAAGSVTSAPGFSKEGSKLRTGERSIALVPFAVLDLVCERA